MRRIALVLALMIVAFTASPAHAAIPDRQRTVSALVLEKRIKALEARLTNVVQTPGPMGERGPTGFTGRDGRDGQSIAGPAGPIGAIGPKGERGESIAGPAGPAGTNGTNGIDGAPGRDGSGLPSGTILLIGGDCPSGTSVQGTAYQWRVYQGNPFTGTGSELWVSACRVN